MEPEDFPVTLVSPDGRDWTVHSQEEYANLVQGRGYRRKDTQRGNSKQQSKKANPPATPPATPPPSTSPEE